MSDAQRLAASSPLLSAYMYTLIHYNLVRDDGSDEICHGNPDLVMCADFNNNFPEEAKYCAMQHE